jgi:hypothetical protein
VNQEKMKKAACALAMLLTLSSFAGCFGKDSQSSSDLSSTQSSTQSSIEESSSESSSMEEVDEGLLYDNRSNEIKQLKSGEEIVVNIDKEVANNNFLTIQLRTDCNLVGYIHYSKTGSTSVKHQEKIYIEADAESFSMFLDAFRVGAFGAYEKKIEKITFRNISITRVE